MGGAAPGVKAVADDFALLPTACHDFPPHQEGERGSGGQLPRIGSGAWL